MRIRLIVKRESIPDACVIWECGTLLAAKPNARVTTLLKSISQTFPLEIGCTGLEDYVATIGGFELLQWQRVVDVIREMDEVV